MENKILAKVNGNNITEKDVEFAISQFPQDRRAMLKTAEGKKQILMQMISYELLYNYGKDNGLYNNENFKLQVEAFKKQALIQTAISEVLKDLSVTDKEAEAYYKDHEDEFKENSTVTASHILVSTEEECLKVKKEIESGLSFEEAAKKYSSCPSKEQGGNLGAFGRGMMVPEFDKAAFSLPVGVVSDPVKTTFGYHLIKVYNIEKAPKIEFKDCADSIKKSLLQNKEKDTYVNFTEELKNKYKVEYME